MGKKITCFLKSEWDLSSSRDCHLEPFYVFFSLLVVLNILKQVSIDFRCLQHRWLCSEAPCELKHVTHQPSGSWPNLYFWGFTWLYWQDKLRYGRKQDEREAGWHTAKGPRPLGPRAAAARTKHLHIGRPLHQLSQTAPRVNLHFKGIFMFHSGVAGGLKPCLYVGVWMMAGKEEVISERWEIPSAATYNPS